MLVFFEIVGLIEIIAGMVNYIKSKTYKDKLEEKIKDKDSFVVVVGSDKDNTTLNYKNVCLKYLEKNHSDKIYYVNLAKENNATTYIQKTFKTDDGTIPSTFVMKNGKVKVQKSGSLSYYRIAELFK